MERPGGLWPEGCDAPEPESRIYASAKNAWVAHLLLAAFPVTPVAQTASTTSAAKKNVE